LKIKTIALSSGFVALLVSPVWGNERSRKIALRDLPAAVRRTVAEQSRGGKIRAVVSEVEAGKTVYEATLIVNGRKRNVQIDETGTELEVEEEIPVSELPEKAKSAAMKAGWIRKAESVTKDGKVVFYEISVKANGKKSEIKLSPEGERVEK
jgi:uncharacterized membrane protein YkoI